MKSKPHLPRDEQINLLRNTAKNINERMEFLSKVNFDDDLASYVTELSAITDVISDSCVFGLKTPDEIEELAEERRQEADYRRYTTAIYSENRI